MFCLMVGESSDLDCSDLSVEKQVDDLCGVLDAVYSEGLPKIVLIGHRYVWW